MTKIALKKIMLCLALFASCLALCWAIDGPIGSWAIADEPHSDRSATTDESDEPISERSLIELIENDERASEELAKRYLDCSLETDIPEDFRAEALDPNTFEDAFRCGSVLGFIYGGPLDEAVEACQGHLEEKGWLTLVPRTENERRLISFAKATGTYRWITVQFVAMNERTTVIVNTVDPV